MVPILCLGALYFLALGSREKYSYFLLGLLAGLLTFARSDGLLWLGLALFILVWRFISHKKLGMASLDLLLTLGGFLLIMGPWFWRTYSIYGTLLAPGGGHLLWLTNYDETFIYPATQLTPQSWLSIGLGQIVSARLLALRWNLLNAFAAQGGIFLFPFILVGIWKYRKDERIRLGILAWLGLLFVMTVIFPYAGARGGFFHSGAALQSLWWTLAPLGLEVVVIAARKRNLFTPNAIRIFGGALVGIAILMTAVIIYLRVLRGWGEGEQNYPKIEAYLQQAGIQPGRYSHESQPTRILYNDGPACNRCPLWKRSNHMGSCHPLQCEISHFGSRRRGGTDGTIVREQTKPAFSVYE